MLNRFRRITSDTWFALGLEFFAIVVGVMFALYVDKWREDRQVAEINAITVERLNEEILHNQEALARTLRVVKERYARLAALDVGTDSAFVEKLAQFGGYSFPDLKSSAWERMSNDALANRIDPPYLIGATELYGQNRLFTQLSDKILELLVSETFHDPARAPMAGSISLILLQQQVQWQSEALARYEDFIHRFIAPAKSASTTPPANASIDTASD